MLVPSRKRKLGRHVRSTDTCQNPTIEQLARSRHWSRRALRACKVVSPTDKITGTIGARVPQLFGSRTPWASRGLICLVTDLGQTALHFLDGGIYPRRKFVIRDFGCDRAEPFNLSTQNRDFLDNWRVAVHPFRSSAARAQRRAFLRYFEPKKS